MQQRLPLGKIRFLTEAETEQFSLDASSWNVDSNTGFFLCVDVEFGEHTHKRLNWMPPLPIKRKIFWSELSPWTQSVLQKRGQGPKQNESTWFVERLITDLKPRECYWVHWAHLKLCIEELGVTLVRLRQVISFEQQPYVAPYINKTIGFRKTAKTKFESNQAKLSGNGAFGRFIQNVREFLNVRFARSAHTLRRQASEATFKGNNRTLASNVKFKIK